MNKCKFLLVIFLGILFSCETDFDVNAPWQETAVIYGLLDQTLDTQRIIIYKSFLGKESGYVMAQETDSFYYDENDLEVFFLV